MIEKAIPFEENWHQKNPEWSQQIKDVHADLDRHLNGYYSDTCSMMSLDS